ncbi:NADP-dependent alcohol dehydrogenase [Ceratobasidium sp. 394]|nr:NADP-dependent alcohol dehydrogenase [Ceratobasidium sp. 394]
MSSKSVPFKGYAIHDTKKWVSQSTIVYIQPKQWEEEDIDITVTYCGVCGSDLHILTGGWQNVKQLPLVQDGTLSQGGYGTAIRANHRFVVPIPEGIKSEHAASVMCAGLTMYSPLTRQNVGPGSKVGIVGLGGLALGAEVYAFSPDTDKEEDMKKLGADHYVVTTKENLAPLERTFDIILSTVDLVEGFQLRSYLKLLLLEGIFVNIGLPDHMLPQ